MSLEPDTTNRQQALPSLDDALAHARLPSHGGSLPARDVVVVGSEAIFAGIDARTFTLGELQVPSRERSIGGCDRVLFRTVTGNEYHVSRTSDGAFVVYDARSARERVLQDSAASALKLDIGERLDLPKRHTGHIKQILLIDSSRAVPIPTKLRDLCSVASRNFGGLMCFEGPRHQTAQEQKIPARIHVHRRPLLLINGSGLALGMERTSFDLTNLRQFIVENKHALEVLFRTSSGNIYGLIRTRKGGLLLLNARYGKENAVSPERLAGLTLTLGERFPLNATIKTSPVSQIVAVHKATRSHDALTIDSVGKQALGAAGGNVSTIRNELMRACCERLGDAHMKKILKAGHAES